MNALNESKEEMVNLKRIQTKKNVDCREEAKFEFAHSTEKVSNSCKLAFVVREQVARKDILESVATGKKETVGEDSLVRISMSIQTSTPKRSQPL